MCFHVQLLPRTQLRIRLLCFDSHHMPGNAWDQAVGARAGGMTRSGGTKLIYFYNTGEQVLDAVIGAGTFFCEPQGG